MGDNSVKSSKIKILKPHPHAHLHIMGRKSTEFQLNLMKDVGGVVERSSFGRMDGRIDRIKHTLMDEGHFYVPLLCSILLFLPLKNMSIQEKRLCLETRLQ